MPVNIGDMKLKRAFTGKKAIFGIIFVCVFVLSINTYLRYVPTEWSGKDITAILKLLLQWQSFPLQSVPSKPHKLSVSFTDILSVDIDLTRIGHHTNFYLYKIENEKDKIKNLDSSTELESFLNFQPMMSSEERKMLLYIFHVFIEVCKKYNFTYFVMEGTLLGVYRHMGLIPWDDDIDVIMDAADWKEIRNAFSGIKEIELLTDNIYQWKLFPKNVNSSDKTKAFKWPFMDIFFYAKDDSNIWGLTPALKPHFLYAKTDIFPLKSRPFENLKVNVPRNMEKIVPASYNTSQCVTGEYLHKRNRPAPSHMIKHVPCIFLFNLYPFVFRHVDVNSGYSVEELRIGSTLLIQKEYA